MSDWNVPHSPEPPGSPAYVRRLRDSMVSRFLEGLSHGNWEKSLPVAIERANEAVAALGYQVPEDGGTP